MIQNEEFIQEFVEEAKSHVENIEALLLKKEELLDSEVINTIFRAVHSIKGTAGFFGLKNIVSLSHTMENIFGEARNGKLKLDDDKIDILLRANDCIKEMVENVFESENMDLTINLFELAQILVESTAENKEKEETSKIIVTGGKHKDISIEGTNSEIIKDALMHGHRLFELKLKMNRDLLNYVEGPVKLFNRIQSVGMLVDTITNHSEINSLDDVLAALGNEEKDIYLGVLVTTALDALMLSEVVGIPVTNINEMKAEVFNLKSEVNVKEIIETEDVKVNKVETEDVKVSEVETFEIEVIEKVAVETNEKQVVQKSGAFDDSVRVHVSLLNDLMNMASEMVLGRNQLLRTLENYRKTIPGLASILQNIDLLTSGLQGKIMQTRMQSLGTVFNKFPRMIRDMSKSLSKEIELVIEGEGVELDKSIIEGLSDPLTHLIRNSADHGLESLEDRKKAGKPSCGIIKLRAYQEGGYVNVDVQDDGKGISIEKIKQKAIEKEIISKSEIEKMNDQDILKLIFKPGFSTAEKITDVSGRGVGMDVVKTNIEKLGGSVEIYTIEGVSTTIRLMLPLTLAIMQSLIVEVENQKFAIPQANVKEIVKIKAGDTNTRIEVIHDAQVLRLRGRLLPVVHLADVLGIGRTFIDPNTGVKKQDRRKAFQDIMKDDAKELEIDVACRRDKTKSVTRILVLKIGGRSFGIAVDLVIGSEEILVKPLPIYLKSCICYSGVTIMGDGKAAMILDGEGIIKSENLKFIEENVVVKGQEESNHEEIAEIQNIILFKCSGSETYAVDMSMIARIIQVKREDIETIGDKMYIKHIGKSLQVIHPEEYTSNTRNTEFKDKIYVLIPKLVRKPIGILAEKIYDNISIRLKLSTDDIQMDCLVGSAVYNNKTLLALNIYQLFEKADPKNYSSIKRASAEKKSLLLVEDTAFFQKMAISYLETAGYEVVLAENGKVAIDILQTRTFDAVVSDIQMPIMDGFELVRKIRASERLKDLPVIAVTSMTGDHNKEIGIEKGFDYYEYKLDRDSLLNTIEKALAGRRDGEHIVKSS